MLGDAWPPFGFSPVTAAMTEQPILQLQKKVIQPTTHQTIGTYL